MIISHDKILALQHLKGFGLAAVNAVKSYLEGKKSESICNTADSWDLIRAINSLQRSRQIARKEPVSIQELENAIAWGGQTLTKNRINKIKTASIDSIDEYPSRLKGTVDEAGKPTPPILIHYKGNINLCKRPSVAIIGTRKPTPAGIKAGQHFGKLFAEIGFNVISGLAMGCDTAAHQGALLAKDGVTTAVLAGGLDSIYPKENSELAEKILAHNGLLISENPAGTVTDKYNLVARDRLQAALADIVVVIQTSANGGTMHAVRAAMAAGKKVYCVKFRNEVDITDGARYLVENGAEWIRNEDDVNKAVIELCKSKSWSGSSMKLIFTSGFKDLDNVGRLKYFYRYDYYSETRYPTVPEYDELIRRSIWQFKDGQKELGVKTISQFLQIHYSNEDIKELTLCVIPASTKERNQVRYEKMCEELSAKFGIQNGYSLITILKDRETSHLNGKSDNTIKDLDFSSDIAGRKILLFDDITTRGLTFIQHAEKLLQMGAESVVGLFLGKTVN